MKTCDLCAREAVRHDVTGAYCAPHLDPLFDTHRLSAMTRKYADSETRAYNLRNELARVRAELQALQEQTKGD